MVPNAITLPDNVNVLLAGRERRVMCRVRKDFSVKTATKFVNVRTLPDAERMMATVSATMAGWDLTVKMFALKVCTESKTSSAK